MNAPGVGSASSAASVGAIQVSQGETRTLSGIWHGHTITLTVSRDYYDRVSRAPGDTIDKIQEYIKKEMGKDKPEELLNTLVSGFQKVQSNNYGRGVSALSFDPMTGEIYKMTAEGNREGVDESDFKATGLLGNLKNGVFGNEEWKEFLKTLNEVSQIARKNFGANGVGASQSGGQGGGGGVSVDQTITITAVNPDDPSEVGASSSAPKPPLGPEIVPNSQNQGVNPQGGVDPDANPAPVQGSVARNPDNVQPDSVVSQGDQIDLEGARNQPNYFEEKGYQQSQDGGWTKAGDPNIYRYQETSGAWGYENPEADAAAPEGADLPDVGRRSRSNSVSSTDSDLAEGAKLGVLDDVL
jgi:hypothetical protein